VKSAVVAPIDVKLMNMAFTLLLIVLVVLYGLTAIRWVSRQSVFDLQRIVVTGDTQHNNSHTLRANVAPRVAGTFFTVDLAKVRATFESVPWVRKAVVRREFPNYLRVHLQEHQTAALWGGNGETRLLNTHGEIFEANVGEVDQDHLPTLSGPDAQAAEVLNVYRTLEPMFSGMEMVIEQLELSGRGGWSLQLENGAVIELGRGGRDELVARSERFLKTLTQVVSRYGRQAKSVESADLRHENGYAIRLRGVTTHEGVLPKK